MSKRQRRADRLRKKHPEDAKLSNKKIIETHGEKSSPPEKKTRHRR